MDSIQGIYAKESENGGFGLSVFVYEKEKEMSFLFDYNGNEIGVELGAKINFCPMCGRKL